MRQPWFAHGDRKECWVFEQPNFSLEVYAKTFRHHLERKPNNSACMPSS